MRGRAALVVVATALFTVSGMPSGLAEEPAPTESAAPDAAQEMSLVSTVEGSHVSTNTWSIHSTPKNQRVELRGRSLATVDYLVEVTHEGRTLTAFALGGTITVANAGSAERAVTITHSVPGTTCTVTDGVDLRVPAAGSTTAAFTCVPDAGFQPRDTDTSTSTLTWVDDGVEHSISSEPQEVGWDGLYIDNTVDVHDIDGDELSVLGSLMVSPDGTLQLLTPESGTVRGATAAFGYRVQLDGTAGGCRDYDTKAVIAGDDGRHVAADDASVSVCMAAPVTPGLPHTGR